MTIQRKTFDSRERDLKYAISRISRGRAHTGESKVTISAVAREAGVSTALIHNHYPSVAEEIREIQGKASRQQRDAKQQDLKSEREKNKKLQNEIVELGKKISKIASINEVLMAENKILNARLNDPKVSSIRDKN